jgi:glycerol-3-phosphate dehydrogenase
MIRRTSWHYYHADAAEIAADVAHWMSPILEWDDARRAEELERYRKSLLPEGTDVPGPIEGHCDL